MYSTSKPDRAYALRPFIDRKMNQGAPERMKISNPRGHLNYKKSEVCSFRGYKIVLHTFDADLNQKEITR